MYFAFLRFNDLKQVSWERIHFSTEGMHVFLPCSKTDQYRQGASIPVARSNDDYCPVLLTEVFLDILGHAKAGPGPLIRILGATKRAAARDRFPSFPTISTWCKRRFAAVGLDTTHLGTHSLRKAAATVAANSGVPSHILKQLGRWRSDLAKDGYIVETDDTMYSASLSLALAQPKIDTDGLIKASARKNRRVSFECTV
jgi:integrase